MSEEEENPEKQKNLDDFLNVNADLIKFDYVIFIVAFILTYANAVRHNFVGGIAAGIFAVLIPRLFKRTMRRAKAKTKAKEDASLLAKAVVEKINEISLKGFSISKKIFDVGKRRFILVDESGLQLAAGNDEKYKLYPLENVINIEVFEDEKTLLSTPVAGVLVGGLIGGALFGEEGSVVGALAGQNTGTVNSVRLVVSVSEDVITKLEIEFLEKSVSKNSNKHLEAVRNANESHAYLHNCIKHCQLKKQKEAVIS